jgi:hypothetical protein
MENARFSLQIGHADRMSTPAISNADMVEIQLRKWMARGYVLNATLRPTYPHPFVPAGDTVVAEIIDRAGKGVFLRLMVSRCPVEGLFLTPTS